MEEMNLQSGCAWVLGRSEGGMFQNVPLNNPKRQLKMPRKRFQSQSEMMKMSRPPSDPENNLNRKMQQKIPLI